MSQFPQPPDQRPPVPLNYMTPQPDPKRPAGNVPFIAQMAIGFVAFLIIGGVGISLGVAFWRFDIVLATFGAMAVITVVAQRRWRWRGFIVGELISLGLILLAVGLCFAALR